MTHRPECDATTVLREIVRSKWKQKWPHHCTRCEGAGAKSYPNDPPENDECVSCTDKGICARCGKIGWDLEEEGEIEGPCRECGWNWGKNPDDIMPPQHECRCWEDESGYNEGSTTPTEKRRTTMSKEPEFFTGVTKGESWPDDPEGYTPPKRRVICKECGRTAKLYDIQGAGRATVCCDADYHHGPWEEVQKD